MTRKSRNRTLFPSHALQTVVVVVAPIFRSATQSVAGANVLFVNPSQIAAGDLLVVCIGQVDAVAADVTVTGWTLIGRSINVSGPAVTFARLQCFYRIADGTEGATTLISGSAGFSQVVCGRWTGPKTASPLDTYTIGTGTSNPVANAGMTPAYDNEVLALFSTNAYGETAAWTGATQRNIGVTCFYTKTAPAKTVATGTLNASDANAVATSTMVIAIRGTP